MTRRVTALLTCHNRKAKTLECLAALFCAESKGGLSMDAVLVDDGSEDGTAQAVAAAYPDVIIERGDGNLFWSRGMHRAQQVAARSQPDFLLWLNDDTVLVPGALDNLLAVHDRAGRDVVVVGATVEASSGELTYGGMRPSSRWRRFSFTKLPLAETAQECDAMNGNIVLVPRVVYERVGALDPMFEHALGDIDYALRVRANGFPILVAPGSQGVCSANKAQGSHLDPALPARTRWQKFVGRKGLPPASWRHFVRRHVGWAWPAYFIYPYVNFALRAVRESAPRSKDGGR